MQNSRNCRRFILIVCARYDAAMVIINILKKLKKGEESLKGEAHTEPHNIERQSQCAVIYCFELRQMTAAVRELRDVRPSTGNRNRDGEVVAGRGGEWMVQNIGKGIASGSMVRPHTKSFEEPSGLSLKFIYLYLLLAGNNLTKNEKKNLVALRLTYWQ